MSDYQDFLISPSLEQLEKYNKNELFELTKVLELEVKRSMRKNELKKRIIEILVDDDLLPEEALGEYSSVSTSQSGLGDKNRLEIHLKLKQIELEHSLE